MGLMFGGWALFCVMLAVVLITALIMQILSGFFITKDVLVQEFTMLDLELASSEKEIDNTLKGIPGLDPLIAGKVVQALKNHLYVDFVFMAAACCAIFIACMQVSFRMPPVGIFFFCGLAWLQVLALIGDLLENIYLIKKVYGITAKDSRGWIPFRIFRTIEWMKWSCSLVAVACVLSALLYFWLSGNFRISSLHYVVIVAIELGAYLFLLALARNRGRFWKRSVPK